MRDAGCLRSSLALSALTALASPPMLGGCWPGATPSAAPATAAGGTLEVSPNPLSLGVLRPGQDARAELAIRNAGPDPVVIARSRTSCPCITLQPIPLRLGPGESAALTVRFDPDEEPEFRGGLSVAYSFHDAVDVVLCRGAVDLIVRKDSRKSGGLP